MAPLSLAGEAPIIQAFHILPREEHKTTIAHLLSYTSVARNEVSSGHSHITLFTPPSLIYAVTLQKPSQISTSWFGPNTKTPKELFLEKYWLYNIFIISLKLDYCAAQINTRKKC